jgi:AraC-like DNA-binding protein/Tfp pilus assembly protein PilF
MFKHLFAFTFLLSITAYIANGQEHSFHPFTDSEIIAKYKHLSPQQLLDSGNYHYRQNNIDEALVCLDLLINLTPQSADIEHQKIMIEAYHRSATIYFLMDNYRAAYDLLLKALQLSEAINDNTHRARIYISLGNIYHRLGKQDLAKMYFTEALSLTRDRAIISLILNNLGYASIVDGDMRDAHYSISQSLQIAKQYNPSILHIVMHSMAAYYWKTKVYDSAYHYFQLSINEAREDNTNQHQKSISLSLSDLSKLFFEINKPDSATFYINRSNIIAAENGFLGILMENYLTLSKIAESKGNKIAAFEYFRHYSNLKDSILNHEKIVDINQIQRSYEISKAGQQIEQLTIDRQVKDSVIRYQKIIQYIMLIVLILTGSMLAFMFIQHKKLNTAYRKLFEKNIKIIEFQEDSSEAHLVKHKKSTLTDEMQSELLNRIYALLKDVSVVCDPELSVEKLADLLQSNRAYISQVVNDTLKKNFRALINEYRIREAQRLLLDMDISKYTIESIALRTGFKSRNTFNIAFKDITGVTPSFYLKSMQNR